MNRKPLDSIDNLIRHAADQYQPAYDEAAWQLMQQKLDQKESKKRKPFFIWFAILLVASLAITYYSFHSQTSVNNGTIANNENTINSNSSKFNIESPPISTSPNNHAITTIGSNKQPAPINAAINKVVQDKKQQINHKNIEPVSSNNTASNYEQSTDFSSSGFSTKYKKNRPTRSAKGKAKVNIEPAISDENNETASTNTLKNVNATETIENPREITATKIQSTPDSNQQKLVASNLPSEENTKTKATTKKSSTITAPKQIYIGLAFGTEGAATKFSGLQSPLTLRWGLQLGYRLNKHFSLQAGYFYNTKKYTGTGKDYNFAPGSYLGAVNVTKVDAECKMIEIPISLRYQAKFNKQIQWYLQTGISSYILNQEDYEYHYYRYNNPQVKTSYYTGNKHAVSQLTFGGGLERNFTSKISLIAEIYSNVPLKGMGAGSVKIYNTGFITGIRYYPFAPQSK
ncbi:MAG: hypothetical protein RLY16_2068 [Bacteroidota bacterium]|jgi:hypothetical protein